MKFDNLISRREFLQRTASGGIGLLSSNSLAQYTTRAGRKERNGDAMTQAKPNIVFIMCDEMRWDSAGFAGSSFIQTPNLDRLAEAGVCFENAYCASPVCSPARASWFTGLYPHAHLQLRNYSPRLKGVWGSHMPESCITIGDVLKQAGYHCANVGVWHLGNDHAPQHGFVDFWRTYRYLGPDHTDPLFDYFKREGVLNLYAGNAEGITKYENTLPFGTITDPRQQRTTWTIDRSLEFLGRTHEEPFLLLIGIKDPHPRMLVSQELLDLYPEEQIPLPDSLRDPLVGKPGYQSSMKFRVRDNVTDQQFRRMFAHYYALITHIDRQVGRLLAALQEKGLADNTIVVFTSDHGEMLGDHGFVEKCLMYDPSVKVPCLVSWSDKLPAGMRVKTPLAGVDLIPTLLDLAGVPIPEPIDGRSVAEALLSGSEPEPQPIFAEIASQQSIYGPGDYTQDREHMAAHIMALDGRWKYVRNRFDDDELYDLQADPDEMSNMANLAEHQEQITTMRRQIAEMLSHTGPGLYDWCLDDQFRGHRSE